MGKAFREKAQKLSEAICHCCGSCQEFKTQAEERWKSAQVCVCGGVCVWCGCRLRCIFVCSPSDYIDCIFRDFGASLGCVCVHRQIRLIVFLEILQLVWGVCVCVCVCVCMCVCVCVCVCVCERARAHV